jgi:hypothetical protein
MTPDKHDVFRQVREYGADRYLIGSYEAHGLLLPQLDEAIWDVRRYCQPALSHPSECGVPQGMFDLTIEELKNARSKPHRFKIAGGYLEKVLSGRNHPAYSALSWQNRFYGRNNRPTVRALDYMEFSNAPLWLYPEMIDDLANLITINDEMIKAYRKHRDDIASGLTTRP